MREAFLAQMVEVITGRKDTTDKVDYISPDQAEKLLLSAGFKIESKDFDTNGWDYDYWLTLKINGKFFVVTGSGYYGQLQFYIQEKP
jgi:hypothetical protein